MVTGGGAALVARTQITRRQLRSNLVIGSKSLQHSGAWWFSPCPGRRLVSEKAHRSGHWQGRPHWRSSNLWHLWARGMERPRLPIRVGKPVRGHRIDLSFSIVVDPANIWLPVFNQQIRSAGIAVKRLADAPRVDHGQPGQIPHERLVNVAVHHNRLTERQISRFEFGISCVRERRTPRACGTGVHQRDRRVNDNLR